MFKKLISNLPFSPGLLPQISFYARRINQENTIRRMGLVFAGLTLIMQSLIFFSPATPSLAGSGNDLIYGGLRKNGIDMTHNEAVQSVIKNVYSSTGDTNGLKALFKHYGVTEQMVKNSRTSFVCSQRVNRTVNGVDCNKSAYDNIRSIGRQTKSTEDVKISPSGTSKTFYHRPLSVFDKLNPVNTYRVLELVPNELYILYSCGNLAFSQSALPELDITKKILNKKSEYAVGDTLQFEVTINNTGSVAATAITLADQLDSKLTALKASSGGRIQNLSTTTQIANWNISSLAPGETFKAVLNVKVSALSRSEVCNKARVKYDNGYDKVIEKESNKVCLNVKDKEPEVVVDPAPQPQPQPVCESLSSDTATAQLLIPTAVNFTPILSLDGLTATSYEYFVNDVSQGKQNSPEFTYNVDSIGQQQVSVLVEFSDGTISDSADCTFIVTGAEEENPEVDTAKSARIVSSYDPVQIDDTDPRSSDAQNQEVKPNEIIEYTVTVSNVGNVEIKDYKLPEDDLRDVLEYADVIDNEKNVATSYEEPIQLRGGGELKEGILSWNKVDALQIGETITKTFFVKVKSKIPTTNTPPSDALSYDCIMSNVYENSVDIDVDCSAEKEIIMTTTTLPNTGPVEVAAVTMFFLFMSVYLYLRNKQLSKELRIVKTEYNGGY